MSEGVARRPGVVAAAAREAADETRAEDQPLHDDVRWLAATLGRVIRRLEGDDAYEIVEELRRGSVGTMPWPSTAMPCSSSGSWMAR